MARIKYLGRKENYGPLNLEWMEETVEFPDGKVSTEISKTLAKELCECEPRLFVLTLEKPVVQEDDVDTVDFEDMTIDRLLEYGAPLEGFSCTKRDGKTKIIEAIEKCLPAQ